MGQPYSSYCDGFLLLFASGARVIYIVGAFLIAIPVAYYFLMNVGYRSKRMMSFIRPWEDPTGNSFQIIQSFLSFGSGGLFGLGLGEGRQKLSFSGSTHRLHLFCHWRGAGFGGGYDRGAPLFHFHSKRNRRLGFSSKIDLVPTWHWGSL